MSRKQVSIVKSILALGGLLGSTLALFFLAMVCITPDKQQPSLGTAPTCTIVGVPASLNALSGTHAAFTINGGSPGYSYTYSVTSSGGTNSILGAGTVGSTAYTTPQFNVTNLSTSACTLTYTAGLATVLAGTNTTWGSSATTTVPFNPTALASYYSGSSPNDPFTHNTYSGAILVNNSYGVLGSGTASTNGTGGLSLSGSASNPCSSLTVSTTGSGVLLGSGTGAGTLQLPANTPLTFPLSNTNLLYISGGTVSVGYLWFQ